MKLHGAEHRFCVLLLFFLWSGSSAFQSSLWPVSFHAQESRRILKLRALVEETPQHHKERIETSYRLSNEEISPIIRLSQGQKEKVINAFGLWCAVVTLFTAPLWALAMTILNFYNRNVDPSFDPNRALYDKTGKIWAKAWLTLSDSYPTASGEVDFLREEGKGPCLYVANHGSWLDIPVLCTVLDPVFKFIAKGELAKVPCIGQQLKGGDHILIDRDDRRSQLRTFKEGIQWLKKGVPIMAFPEGQRSPEGRLIDFKGGLFSMAVKTGVPIVPLSISHTNAIMPGNALFPVQSGRGKLHVHVHSPIESTGRTDAELSDLVRQAFLSELPLDHLPRDLAEEELLASSAVSAIRIETEAHLSHQKEHHHAVPTPKSHVTSAIHDPHAVPSASGKDSSSHFCHYAIDVKEEIVEKV